MQDQTPFFLAGFLTWIAGFVDAVGFLALGHIYTANMSGNSVSLGIQITSQNWPETIRRLLPVVGYVMGLLCSRLLIEFGARQRIRSIASIPWLCEILLLLPAAALNFGGAAIPPELSFAYIGLIAIAMGIQNATLTHFSSLTLNTGFVTGTLVQFAEELAQYLTWLFDEARKPQGSLRKAVSDSSRRKSFRFTAWLGVLWVAYVAGACCGTLGDYSFRLKSLAVPIASLAVLVAIDLRKPLGIREEKAQSSLPA